MSFSAHKTYGPKGIGALYVRRKPRVRIEAQMHGGGHERGMRSGTLPTHQIVGMGEAFRIAQRRDGDRERAHPHAARPPAGRACQDIEEVYVNGDLEHRVPHNLNVQLQLRRGRVADHGDQGHRGVVGLGLHVGVARAVLRAARAGPQRRARAQLDPLHHRPLHDRGGDRLRDRPRSSGRSRKLRELSPLWEMYKDGIDIEHRSSGPRTEHAGDDQETTWHTATKSSITTRTRATSARSTRATTTSAPAWSARRPAAT